ncbi:polysaccharide biosynthesis protein [Eubacteriales bacterium OttesenSCG-928-N14]|nr:polysaccharide biosynthesis protein [Eubacteriales bacterium OttesenSCG-928-N14]
MSESTKRSFVQGAAVLGAAGIICKIIGALFRVPLGNILSESGMAYYQVAYPIYTTLLMISSAGIPAAISKMVSERVAVDDYRNAHYVYQVSYRMLLLIGLCSMTLLMALSYPIAAGIGMAESYPTLLAIAPSLFFVSVISAYRGYFQGLQMMTPTAISQLIEQIVKLIAGFGLAAAMVGMGELWGAVGAVIGVTLSELVSMAYLFITYGRRSRDIRRQIRSSPRVKSFETQKEVAKKLLTIAVPITIGASIMPLVNLIDTAMVTNVLKAIGYGAEQARSRYGLLTGYVAPIINVPSVLSTALQVSLVPAISALMTRRRADAVRHTAQQGLKLAIIIGLPCAVGLFILAGPITAMLYRTLEYDSIVLATTLMQVMSIATFLLIMIQTATGIIQGIGRPRIPVRNLAIGAGLKVITTFVLMRYTGLNIVGAPIGTCICYATAAGLNIYYLFYHIGLSVNVGDFLLRPLACTAVMGLSVFGVYMLLSGFIGNSISTLLSVVIGVAIYAVMVMVIGAIKPEDARILPGGAKLDSLMRNLGLWR